MSFYVADDGERSAPATEGAAIRDAGPGAVEVMLGIGLGIGVDAAENPEIGAASLSEPSHNLWPASRSVPGTTPLAGRLDAKSESACICALSDDERESRADKAMFGDAQPPFVHPPEAHLQY